MSYIRAVDDAAFPMLAPPPERLLQDASLFLDFDGTLVELAERPDSVVPSPRLHSLLARLRDALHGRLAIVSGRSVATLRAQFGLDAFLLAGSHGLEQARPGQPPSAPARPSSLPRVARALEHFAATRPGLLVEEKTLGVGLHFRQAPQYEAECLAICAALASETGLFLQQGKMLFELRPGQGGKGQAVTRFLSETELGARRPVFIGDDVTDEDGFAAVAQHGGAGILVGPQRATAAHYRLEGVAEVHRWLANSRTLLEEG